MSQLEFFETHKRQIPQNGNPDLCQFFTPEWAGEEIVSLFFQELDEKQAHRPETLCEPSCGKGAILKAIPTSQNAFGIEIDPLLAEKARQNCHHPIFTGDFTSDIFPLSPDGFVGNPPFKTEIFDQFLQRAHGMLPEGGLCLFLLPTYFFQSSSRVETYHQNWSIHLRMTPRDLFPNLSLPLCAASFIKERTKKLVGFFLYGEIRQINQLHKNLQDVLRESQGKTPCWEALVTQILQNLGGSASPASILQAAGKTLPTTNHYPREKIRQTLQRGKKKGIFSQPKSGMWELSLNNRVKTC